MDGARLEGGRTKTRVGILAINHTFRPSHRIDTQVNGKTSKTGLDDGTGKIDHEKPTADISDACSNVCL